MSFWYLSDINRELNECFEAFLLSRKCNKIMFYRCDALAVSTQREPLTNLKRAALDNTFIYHHF